MRTLIIVKPDWAENQILLNELFYLIRQYELTIVFSKKILMDQNFWKNFYSSHSCTSYFDEMIKWMSNSPSIFLIIEGENAVNLVRWQIIGRNGNGIRGKYQINELKNVAHASDSENSANKEIEQVKILFK